MLRARGGGGVTFAGHDDGLADGTGENMPGGRLAIADVVNVRPLPAELAADKALLCGCVSGAASAAAIQDMLRAAGFSDIGIQVKTESREYIATWAAGRGIEDYVASATIEARKPGICCAGA